MLQCYQQFIVIADCRTASDIIVTDIEELMIFYVHLDAIVDTSSDMKNPLEFVMVKKERWPKVVLLNALSHMGTVILDHSLLHTSTSIIIIIYFFMASFCTNCSCH